MLFYITQEVAVHHKIENNCHSIVFFLKNSLFALIRKQIFASKLIAEVCTETTLEYSALRIILGSLNLFHNAYYFDVMFLLDGKFGMWILPTLLGNALEIWF
jgi:hypothetical protein